MTELSEEVRGEIQALEEQAEEIESLFSTFFKQVPSVSSEVIGAGYYWGQYSEGAENIQREALQKYEVWYNISETLVSEYIPNRLDDFKQHYKDFKERLLLQKKARGDTRKVLNAQYGDFDSQRGILQSIPSKVRIEELRVRKQISQEISQGELDKARNLFDEGETRASGVIAGVALERYLLMYCENREVEYKYNDGIAALSQKLYEDDGVEEVDSSTDKHLQHLASIRAKCAHANEENPKEEEVRRLIEDSEDFIRGRKI